MHDTLQRAARFQDLLGLEDNDTPYAFDGIFSDAGWRARRLSKRKFKLLKRIDAKLSAMLAPGETVRFLTYGSAVSFWESYFGGIAAYYANQRAIVVTDARILLLQVDPRRRPRELVSQIRFPSVELVQRTLFGSTLFRLNDDRKLVFAYVPRGDAKVLRELSTMIAQHVDPQCGGVENLCPHCYATVPGRPAACPDCGGAYKSATRAALLSLVFPGLGDLYMGQWNWAVFQLLGAALVWAGILGAAAAPDAPPGFLPITAFMMVLFVHVPDALVTRYSVRKGLYPHGAAPRLEPAAVADAEREWVAAG